VEEGALFVRTLVERAIVVLGLEELAVDAVVLELTCFIVVGLSLTERGAKESGVRSRRHGWGLDESCSDFYWGVLAEVIWTLLFCFFKSHRRSECLIPPRLNLGSSLTSPKRYRTIQELFIILLLNMSCQTIAS